MRIHQDADVVSRPPRLPSKPAPIVDSSNTRSATFHPVDTRKPNGNSKPSGHFLSEFNVDGCSDVRSIPDPPTPEPRNRRRLSTSVLPRPLRMQEIEKSRTTSQTGGTKRKSLCHVPSPVLPANKSVYPTFPGSPPPPEKSLQVNLCLENDDEFEEDKTSRSKRRRKRQSMELPRELVIPTASSDFVPPRAIIAQRKKSFQGNLQDMQELQALVRGYCNKPREERDTCHEANFIEKTTGYPLVTRTTNGDPRSHENKRTILQKMAPIIEEIDRRKAEDTAKWEYETGCRVERSKSGKYRYIAVDTNTKLRSQEYKHRYMSVIEREASLRYANACSWMSKLVDKNTPSQAQALEEDGGYNSFSALDAPTVTMPSDTEEVDDKNYETTQEFDLDLQEILTSKKACLNMLPIEQAKEDTSMELCDMSASMDLDEKSFLDATRDSEVPKMQEEECKASEENDLEGEPSLHTVEAGLASSNDEQRLKSVTPTEMELLPLPDRDEASPDPMIAQAEQKLWTRIDEALREYSNEVMAILKSRRNKTTN